MDATETKPQSWFQDALKNGLILGAIHIIIFLALYYIVPDALAGFSYLGLVILLNFSFVIYSGIQWRNELGGFMTYGAGFQHAFVMLAASGLLNVVFVALFLFVEPNLPQVMADAQLESSLYWAEKFGAPEESIDQMREGFNAEEIKKRFSLTGQLFGFGIALIFYAIGAAIMALFTRKNVPMDM